MVPQISCTCIQLCTTTLRRILHTYDKSGNYLAVSALFNQYNLQSLQIFLTLSLPSKLSDEVRFYFMAPHLEARTQNKNYGKTGNAFQRGKRGNDARACCKRDRETCRASSCSRAPSPRADVAAARQCRCRVRRGRTFGRRDVETQRL